MESMYLRKNDNRVEMTGFAFFRSLFHLPGSGKGLRQCCPPGRGSAPQALAGDSTAGAAATPCACALRLSQSWLLQAAV